MTSANLTRPLQTSRVEPTIVRDRSPISTARPLTLLESLGRRIIHAALSRFQYGSLTIIDGDRRMQSAAGVNNATAPSCVVRVLDKRFYSAVAFRGSLGAAEAYMDNLWETDDLPGLMEAITVNYTAMSNLEGPLARALSPLDRVRSALSRNTLTGSRRNIRAHYDLSNDFFALFLDPSMTYSCAIFENGAETLADAQVQKMNRACRRLGLRPEHHLLEIGTGWGALAIHAARKYGCRVTTTTISDRQYEWACRHVREAGLADRVTIVQQDYRDLKGQYDRIVSIEMIEAVGAENFGAYFHSCSGLLKPDGAMLLQSIVIRDQYFAGAARTQDFLKKYIFPGSCLPSVAAMVDAIKRRSDLRVWNLEDIGVHYARTLALWRERFMARIPDVRAMGFDDRFIRTWEYYLGYCEGAFRARHVGDVQMLLTKPLFRGPAPGDCA